MTKQALAAAELSISQLETLAGELTEDEWQLPSACPGWRVVDVYAHMAALARNTIEGAPVVPLPEVRERQHDVFVNMRRSMTTAEVLAEWREWTPRLVEEYRRLQEPPASEEEFTAPVLGTYQSHMKANALSFDTLVHLYDDMLAPLGPIQRPDWRPTPEQISTTVEWMMAGLPQMQFDILDDTLSKSVTIELTGPGGSVWTVGPGGAGGKLLVRPGDFGDGTVVVSDAFAFTKWGTTRAPWRRFVTISGEPADVTEFLDQLDII